MVSIPPSIKMKKAMCLMPQSSEKEDLCWQHNEKLHLFCKEEGKLVCVLCEHSSGHQGHRELLLDEAAQQQKDKISNCLKTLRTEREKIRVHIADAETESQEMLGKMESERQQTVDDFKTLHQLLKDLEKKLLEQIEETKKEVARKRDEYVAKLSEELSSLKSLIREAEKKHQQPVKELLQDVRGTLQRYEKKSFENPEAFPSELKNRGHYTPFLSSAMQQFKDILHGAFPKQRATVTLDPASASSLLIISADSKSMQWQSTAQALYFLLWGSQISYQNRLPHSVLGSEGFTAGSHFWEIVVGSGGSWAVGVARKPVKETVTFTPEEGIWAVGSWMGQSKAFIKYTDPPLNLRDNFDRIRVCLNYDKGQVAFFDADRAALLYQFSGASFSGETIYPFFAVRYKGCLWLKP